MSIRGHQEIVQSSLRYLFSSHLCYMTVMSRGFSVRSILCAVPCHHCTAVQILLGPPHLGFSAKRPVLLGPPRPDIFQFAACSNNNHPRHPDTITHFWLEVCLPSQAFLRCLANILSCFVVKRKQRSLSRLNWRHFACSCD